MTISYIYALVDPETNEVRYVGQTSNPPARYKNHALGDDVKPTHPKAIWLRQLKSKGLKPGLVILEKVAREDVGTAETKWIQFYESQVSLTNVMSVLRYEVTPGIYRDRERLLDFMGQNALNLSDLSMIMGLVPSGVCHFLNGRREITDSFRWRFAATFGWEIASQVFPFDADEPLDNTELDDE